MYFGAFGRVELVRIPFYKKKKLNKGFAFLQYSHEGEKYQALNTPIFNVNGKDIFVKDFIDSKEARRATESQLGLKVYVRNLPDMSDVCNEKQLRLFLEGAVGAEFITNVHFRRSSLDNSFKNSASVFLSD